jgi:hypothetical protein
MSYCFDPKENKSYVLSKRNDHILGLLKGQFGSGDDVRKMEEIKIQKYSEKVNKEKAAQEEAKKKNRK